MKMQQFLTSAMLVLSLSAGGALAQSDKEKKQAEVRKMAEATLAKFYKAEPKLKDAVAKSPGYAVFTTYGLSFIVGGAGGKGVAHEPKTKKYTYMNMAQASVGIQIGASETDTLIIFKSVKGMNQFVSSGWEASVGGSMQAGAGGKTAGGGSGENVPGESSYYTLTKNGLQAGGALMGTKFSKDSDLN